MVVKGWVGGDESLIGSLIWRKERALGAHISAAIYQKQSTRFVAHLILGFTLVLLGGQKL